MQTGQASLGCFAVQALGLPMLTKLIIQLLTEFFYSFSPSDTNGKETDRNHKQTDRTSASGKTEGNQNLVASQPRSIVRAPVGKVRRFKTCRNQNPCNVGRQSKQAAGKPHQRKCRHREPGPSGATTSSGRSSGRLPAG